MTEILFYQLKGQTPEQVLPALLQKSLERGWRVVVQGSSEERIEALRLASVDLARQLISPARHLARR